MDLSDAVTITFGALLGFLISIVTIWLQRYNQRREAEKRLLIEVKKVKLEVDVWSSAHSVIPISELPTLRFVGATELTSLPLSVATLAYSLQYDLQKAEENRKIAAANLESQESQIFRIHCHVYGEYIASAKKTLDELRNKI